MQILKSSFELDKFSNLKHEIELKREILTIFPS